MVKKISRPLSQQQNPKRVGPITKPGLDLLEKDEVKAKRPSMWNIVFYNDDYTSIDFVIFVLTKVFHRSTEDALALTLVVHTKGKGIAGTYTFEVAEQKQCEVLLMAKIEECQRRRENASRAGVKLHHGWMPNAPTEGFCCATNRMRSVLPHQRMFPRRRALP